MHAFVLLCVRLYSRLLGFVQCSRVLVRVRACVCAFARVHAHVCVRMRTCVCVRVHAYVCTNMNVRALAYGCMHARVHAHVFVRMLTCASVHTMSIDMKTGFSTFEIDIELIVWGCRRAPV